MKICNILRFRIINFSSNNLKMLVKLFSFQRYMYTEYICYIFCYNIIYNIKYLFYYKYLLCIID